MAIPTRELVGRTSVTARVGFALTVAERVIEHVRYDAEGYALARQALDLAWKWVETGGVSGSQLYELLENEEDTGLLVHEWEAGDDQIRSSAWISLTLALAYTAWHAYKRANETALPEPIAEASEQIVTDVVEHASRTGSLDEGFVRRLCDHLLANERASGPDDRGRPVDRTRLARL